MANKNQSKVKIDARSFLDALHKSGYTRQSMGKKVGCTGRCIGQWMQRGEMPERLYKDIERVLRQDHLSPLECGCDLDGDVFLYHGKEVWIDLRKIWHDGFEACRNLILETLGEKKTTERAK